MRILVTGGAGYIGSITVKCLQKNSVDVVVLDNLVYGHKDSVSCPLIVEDLVDKERVFLALKDYQFDAVIHFAAYALAGESMVHPYKYFYNNIQGGLNLLELMKEKSIPYIVYSSSCAVYGSPKSLPVKESDPTIPESVYGESKLMFEKLLSWYEQIYDIKSISLRYFNAAGASLDSELGENHDPETHLIPTAINCLLEGKELKIFGNNYQTKDGTCIRDYVHVEDLAVAHLHAIQKLESDGTSAIYNLGSGKGYSNLEVVRMIEKVSGSKLNIKYTNTRVGDPPAVYADIKKAKNEINFSPKYSDLKTIVETACKWHKNEHKGL